MKREIAIPYLKSLHQLISNPVEYRRPLPTTLVPLPVYAEIPASPSRPRATFVAALAPTLHERAGGLGGGRRDAFGSMRLGPPPLERRLRLVRTVAAASAATAAPTAATTAAATAAATAATTATTAAEAPTSTAIE